MREKGSIYQPYGDSTLIVHQPYIYSTFVRAFSPTNIPIFFLVYFLFATAACSIAKPAL